MSDGDEAERTHRFQRRTRVRWWRLIPAAVVTGTAGAILVSRWTAVVHSHPAYLLTLVGVVLVGAVVVVSALVQRPSAQGPPPGPRTWVADLRTWVGRVCGVAAAALTVVVLTYLRPLPASEVAVDSMTGTTAVAVDASATRIEVRPTGPARETGLILYPGALVEPRAYVAIVTPIAAAGYPVIIVKAPYNIALLARGATSQIIGDNPTVDRWVVAGHSLGGVAAASVAGGSDAPVDGLLLWASFPNGSIADRDELLVASIYGSEDGLSTPAKISASADDLPTSTEFVEVDGATHAFFGDYGEQAGDGTATISRADAQRQIQDASLALLAEVDRSS